jgi:exopolyphosphatase/guanosine-5'-triphosphate,3'-diphosphate pyrophosphatase
MLNIYQQSQKICLRTATSVALMLLATSCSNNTGSHYSSGDCDQIRAAFEIGTETSKMQTARVDVCEGTIIQTLVRDEIPVSYSDDLAHNSGQFTEDTVNEGLNALKQLKKQAQEYNPVGYVGIATASFQAGNSQANEVLEQYKRQTGIKLELITEQQALRNRFNGALNKAQLESESGVVWEIVNNTMQISTINKQGELEFFNGELGSLNFKSLVIDVLDKGAVNSPNPMTHSEINTAILLAQTRAEKSIPPNIKKSIADEGSVVVGIGGIHVFSIPGSIKNKKTYDQQMLEDAIYSYSDMDDKSLGGGKFVATKITDMAYVLGFMKALDIDEIIARRVDNTDALLVDQKLWWKPVK